MRWVGDQWGALGPAVTGHSLCYVLTQTTSLGAPNNPLAGYVYYSHFTDEKTEAQRGAFLYF